MSSALRVGIVGCGGIARAHLSAYHAAEDVEVVSVFDVAPKAARALAQATGARVARSAGEMARKGRLDAVSICSPPVAQLANCRPFLAAKISVLCEKPLEVNARRAARLADEVKRSRARFMLAFCHRFHPPIIELKKLVRAGTLGRPILFRNIFGGYLRLTGNHRVDPKLSGGGCLIDHCCHAVDLFRFLVGDPTEVQACTANVIQKAPVEDFGMIHLMKGCKAFGEITASYSLKVCRNWVEWYGTKGSAVVNYSRMDLPELAYKVHDSKWTTIDCSSHPHRFAGEIAHFLDCVRRRRKPSITVDDGLKASRIAAAIYASAATRKRVEVKS